MTRSRCRIAPGRMMKYFFGSSGRPSPMKISIAFGVPDHIVRKTGWRCLWPDSACRAFSQASFRVWGGGDATLQFEVAEIEVFMGTVLRFGVIVGFIFSRVASPPFFQGSKLEPRKPSRRLCAKRTLAIRTEVGGGIMLSYRVYGGRRSAKPTRPGTIRARRLGLHSWWRRLRAATTIVPCAT